MWRRLKLAQNKKMYVHWESRLCFVFRCIQTHTHTESGIFSDSLMWVHYSYIQFHGEKCFLDIYRLQISIFNEPKNDYFTITAWCTISVTLFAVASLSTKHRHNSFILCIGRKIIYMYIYMQNRWSTYATLFVITLLFTNCEKRKKERME